MKRIEAKANRFIDHHAFWLSLHGITASKYANEDEISLCWYDENSARHSLVVWLDNGDALHCVVKDGKTIHEKDFNLKGLK
jgi:hypothetical protein